MPNVDQLHTARLKLNKLVRSGHTKSDVIFSAVEEILSCSRSLVSRYGEINVVKLLQDNCQSKPNGIPALIGALAILEKYGKNLLKPDPPPQWRIVRLSNAIFHKRVDNVTGSRDILMLLGYTERIYDGFAFPSNVFMPDKEAVASVTSDIILLKYELSMLQKGQHSFSHDFSAYIYPNRVKTSSLQSVDRPFITKNKPTVNTTQSSPIPQTVFSRFGSSLMDELCVVCGQKPAEFHCEVCKNIQCASCDMKWHQYPKRVHHQRTAIARAVTVPTTVENQHTPLFDISPSPPLNFTPRASARSSFVNDEPLMQTPINQPFEIHEPINMIPPALHGEDYNMYYFDTVTDTDITLPTSLHRLPVETAPPTVQQITYQSAVPQPSSLTPSRTSEETLSWEEKIAFKRNELDSVSDPRYRKLVLDQFCEEIDKESKKFQDGATRLGHSSLISRQLRERSEFLQKQKIELQKLYLEDVKDDVNDVNGFSIGLPVKDETPVLPEEAILSTDSTSITTIIRPPMDPYHSDNFVEGISPEKENRFEVDHRDGSSAPLIETSHQPPKPFPGEILSDLNSPGLGSQFATPGVSRTFSSGESFDNQNLTVNEMQSLMLKEDLRRKCMETVDHLRESELKGFSPTQVKIALKELARERNHHNTPAEWLSNNWDNRVSELMQNNPLISFKDVSDALTVCDGNFEQAQLTIMRNQAGKIQLVSQLHLYDDSAISACLFETNGSCSKALMRLQRPLMHDFKKRLEADIQDNIVVRDFLAIKDRQHLQDALVATLSIEHESVANMMCSIMIESTNPDLTNEPLVLDEYDVEDVLEAARSFPDNFVGAIKYLNNKCMLCLDIYPQNKVECMTTCGDNGCTYCQDCLAKYLQIKIKEGHIRDLVCPVCKLPDIDDDEETATNYFNYLDVIVRTRLDDQMHEVFQQKLRDQALMKTPNFRWCSHCENGFLYEGDATILKMVCSSCHKATCYSCKKPWEKQHEGLSCQAFLEWKQLNDTDFQSKGLAAHLKENGIDCPECKFRYTLAKGGCMHFKCLMCSFQFCSGCKSPFKQGRVCTVMSDCGRKGLHAHHPRDCLFYLRDFDVNRLQKILKDADVRYNTESETKHNFCQVPEQKETSTGLVDDACGREVHKNNADLCELHYKEYLVNLININQLDPASVFSIEELIVCLKRNEKLFPNQQPQQTNDDYRTDLLIAVKELPLIQEKKMPVERLNEGQPVENVDRPIPREL